MLAGLANVGVSARQSCGVDAGMVARLRQEGLSRSRVMDTLSYMTDVLGGRLTLSDDMARAQTWALGQMCGRSRRRA